MKSKIQKPNKEFEELYEQWEYYLDQNFSGDNMYEKNKNFCKKKRKELQELEITEGQVSSIYNIRNADAHSPSFLTINKEAATRLQTLVNHFSKKAMDIATPEQNIYSANLNTPIRKIAQTMEENKYTNVPIIQENNFIGNFSENTVLKLYNQDKIQKNLLVKDIKNILTSQEETAEVEFLNPNVSFFEVVQLFQQYINEGKRLGVIYLTPNGKVSGNIIGIITAWDLYKGKENS